MIAANAPFADGVIVNRVGNLYRNFETLNVAELYRDGEGNPFAGACRIIPSTASFYVTVPIDDLDAVLMAKRVMRGLAGRKKVRQTVCDREAINFTGFAKTNQILVLWV